MVTLVTLFLQVLGAIDHLNTCEYSVDHQWVYKPAMGPKELNLAIVCRNHFFLVNSISVASFALSADSCSGSEGLNALIPVKITKEPNVMLANPVTFRISPLTVAAALNRSLNVPVEAQMMNPDSPIQAGKIKILLLN